MPQLQTKVPTQAPARAPILGVETSVAALIGPAGGGPRHVALRIENLSEFQEAYGAPGGSPLGRAAIDYFANGGSVALCVRADNAVAALAALAHAEPFQLLTIDPELCAPAVLAEAHALCEDVGAMLLVDADQDGQPPTGLGPDAAVYHPALVDPAGNERPCTPAVAGIFAGNDADRGVWSAPAGSHAHVVGAARLARALTDSDLGLLSESNVNGLRTLHTGEVLVWGARTASPTAEWKYVPVRRTAVFVKRSIEEGLQWAAFEPNGEPLWGAVRADVERFLDQLWRGGAFPGATPQEAYFVRCDRTTMTQDDVEQGRLRILVGIAPVKPAEFVMIRVNLTAAARPATYAACELRVTWAGQPVAGFTSAAGLGNGAGMVRQRRPGEDGQRGAPAEPLVLTHGVSLDETFLSWIGRSVGLGDSGEAPRDLTVEVRDEAGRFGSGMVVRRARVETFSAERGRIERLVLTHEGMHRPDLPGAQLPPPR